MKGIIIYNGKYGATQQYAEWIGQELSLPVVGSENITKGQLTEYDFLLIGTSVYIGKLQIKKWLKDNLAFIMSKKIFLFQVAGAPPEEKEKRQTYNRASIPGEILNSLEVYFLPGRMIMQKLSWKDRLLLKMGALLTKDPAEKHTMLTDHDDVKKSHITQIVTDIKSFLKRKATPVSDKQAPQYL